MTFRIPVSHSPRCQCVRCSSLRHWTNGPHSEAARAARGEGTRRMDSGVDYRAAWEGLLSSVSRGTTLREFDAVIGEAGCSFVASFMAGMELIHACALPPDPAHTPAVRRVVAWVGDEDEGPRPCQIDAYKDAAEVLMYSQAPSSARLEARMYALESAHGLEHWSRVLDRLAAWLRHRDEKAGWL